MPKFTMNVIVNLKCDMEANYSINFQTADETSGEISDVYGRCTVGVGEVSHNKFKVLTIMAKL